MKALTYGLFLCLIPFMSHAVERLHELKAKSIDGKEVDLGSYKGKLALVVNVASKCGYTRQYAGLQALYEKHKDKGFVILGFPSNDFGGQEPGSAEEIQKFCKLNYGVNFPLFEKNPVSGEKKQAVFKFLTEKSPADAAGEVKWNFEKFLVAPDGRVVARWRSKTEPESAEVGDAIAKYLPQAAKK